VARLPTRSSNRWLLLAVLGGLGLQALVVLFPPARSVFDTVPLGGREWGLVAVGALVPIGLMLLVERWRRG
jgi:hypothetical protein